MPRGTVVAVDRVRPFSPTGAEGIYVSKMLIDEENSGSERLQVNHGVVKAGKSLPGAAHPAPYDEVYYVLSGEAALRMDGQDYDLTKNMVVYIPAGTHHALTNKSDTEDFVIITLWPGTPVPGANEVYDQRREAWGASYLEI